MKLDSRIYIAGINGMVGSAIHRHLVKAGYTNIYGHSHMCLDLCDMRAVDDVFATLKPEYVFLTAGRVGGIYANIKYPADFLFTNSVIQANVMHCAHKHNVTKLLFTGSSCIYPRLCPQPMTERHLLTGSLEPTNEAYAIAKIAGIKLCESYRKQYCCNFISCMPTNMYGPNDHYDLHNSHVLPTLIRKFHEAKISRQQYVILWGSGSPVREFLYVDDCADACVLLMRKYDELETINIGTGSGTSISSLSRLIASIVGYEGEILYDVNMPNGMPEKVLDITKITKLGWKAKTCLKEGIKLAYADFLNKEII